MIGDIPHILLLNPNSTEFMTDNAVAAAREASGGTFQVTGWTAPKPAPSAIESASDGSTSTAVCLAALNDRDLTKYDGLLVACFSAHPLIQALRERVSIPVIGIMEAALYFARMTGGRFGIVTASLRWEYLFQAAVENYGLNSFFAGAKSSRLSVLELESKPVDEVNAKMVQAAQDLVANGADVLCLGCAGMVGLRAALESALGPDITIIDGVLAGAQILAGMARSKSS
ncbi:hypothetical protein SAICODRAFT_136584 [Saitoella complicata NRRL Y-17804]|uniref:uncharacterized protein n=1 Tax=Saitoella complicata (strain BCRC 22490 / CBS 7301 / JCM 7358 / NBRC 10748 / NRRL Y-17804) TaxID=698492 RepID=UPI00086744FE|nr:uncharacterized protein SAICODRAFT_136584 [Saitoella complicata NRRL Y-17804]ODQ52080.1 hypothetical protein SAICODRAFT_136584 [Saitoella complicata NRRL Y-17804]